MTTNPRPTRSGPDPIADLFTLALRQHRRRRRTRLLTVLVTTVIADLLGAWGLMIALDVLADAAPEWHVPPLGYWTCLWVTLGLGAFAAALRVSPSTHSRDED